MSQNALAAVAQPSTTHRKTIFIIAGEASGDLHGAELVNEFQKQEPNVKFIGMGSSQMREAGVELLVDAMEHSVIGFIEVLAKFHHFYKIFQTLKRAVHELKPDLVLLIDFPGFNLPFAKAAKKAGCKVLYYISPQIWAWKSGRIKKIKRYVDKMAVVFPFETQIYQKANVPVACVEHPLIEKVKPTLNTEQANQLFGKPNGQYRIGLLPGSRRTEIERLLPLQLQTAELLAERYPNVQFLLPIAHTLTDADIEPFLEKHSLNIKIVRDLTYDVINNSDAVIATSGTVTLETALLTTPMVLVYKVNPLTYWLGRLLVKVKYLGICNIMMDAPIIKELIQQDATATKVAAEISRILDDQNYRNQMHNNLQSIRGLLQQKESDQTIAEIAIDMISS